MSDLSQWLSHRVKAWSADVWDGLIKAVDARFAPLEEQLDIQRATTEAIVERGLNVIEFELAPVVAQGADVLGEINTIKTNAQIVLDNIEEKQNLGIPINDIVDLGSRLGSLDGHAAAKNNPHETTKSQVGLGNVDNTSDTDKPVSTATQTALNGKKDNFTLSDYAKTILDDEDAPTARATLGAVAKSDAGLLSGFRNKIINGGLDISLRGSSFVIPAGQRAYTIDRWEVLNATDAPVTVVHGTPYLVGGFTDHYLRMYFASSAPSTGEVYVSQRIEGVGTLSDGVATFTATLNSPSGTPVDFSTYTEQTFGVGGSTPVPTTFTSSVTVSGIGTKITAAATLPSVAGKTFGDGHNLRAVIQFEPRHSNINYDISRVSLVEGDATGEDDPFPKVDLAIETTRCERYCQPIDFQFSAYAPSNGFEFQQAVSLRTLMRKNPSQILLSAGTVTSNVSSVLLLANNRKYLMIAYANAAGTLGVYNREYLLTSEL